MNGEGVNGVGVIGVCEWGGDWGVNGVCIGVCDGRVYLRVGFERWHNCLEQEVGEPVVHRKVGVYQRNIGGALLRVPGCQIVVIAC